MLLRSTSSLVFLRQLPPSIWSLQQRQRWRHQKWTHFSKHRFSWKFTGAVDLEETRLAPPFLCAFDPFPILTGSPAQHQSPPSPPTAGGPCLIQRMMENALSKLLVEGSASFPTGAAGGACPEKTPSCIPPALSGSIKAFTSMPWASHRVRPTFTPYMNLEGFSGSSNVKSVPPP